MSCWNDNRSQKSVECRVIIFHFPFISIFSYTLIPSRTDVLLKWSPILKSVECRVITFPSPLISLFSHVLILFPVVLFLKWSPILNKCRMLSHCSIISFHFFYTHSLIPSSFELGVNSSRGDQTTGGVSIKIWVTFYARFSVIL